MPDRFYVNCPLALGPVEISGPEAHHLATVLRMQHGDAVCLFNGDGAEYQAVILDIHKRQVALDVTARHMPMRELSFRLEVAVPLPKADRGHFLIEKLTELGVSRFIPLRTQRSVVHPRETRLDKFERAVIEASKQCGRNVLMAISPLTNWLDHIHRVDLPASRYVAHPGHEIPIELARTTDVTIAVGPEGGFTNEEVAAAQSADWKAIGLGPRTLRIETAAIALATLWSR